MSTTRFDREALEYASEHYDISLDEPGAEKILRKSFVFASRRFDLAVRQLGREIRDALPGRLRRLFGS